MEENIMSVEKLLAYEELKNKMLNITMHPMYISNITENEIKLISEVCDEGILSELESGISLVKNNSINLESKLMLKLQSACLKIFKQLQAFVKSHEDEIEKRIVIK